MEISSGCLTFFCYCCIFTEKKMCTANCTMQSKNNNNKKKKNNGVVAFVPLKFQTCFYIFKLNFQTSKFRSLFHSVIVSKQKAATALALVPMRK